MKTDSRSQFERAESASRFDAGRRRGDSDAGGAAANRRERKELRPRSPSTSPETPRRAAAAERCDDKNQRGDDRRDDRRVSDRSGKGRSQRARPGAAPSIRREAVPAPSDSTQSRSEQSRRPTSSPSPELARKSRPSAADSGRSSASPLRSRSPRRASTPRSPPPPPPRPSPRKSRDPGRGTEAFADSESDNGRATSGAARLAVDASLSTAVAKSKPTLHSRSSPVPTNPVTAAVTAAAAVAPTTTNTANASSSRNESKNRSDRGAVAVPSTPKRTPVGLAQSPFPSNRPTAHTASPGTVAPGTAAPGTPRPGRGGEGGGGAAAKGRSAFAIDMNGVTLQEVQTSGLPVYRMVRATVEGVQVWVLAQATDFPVRSRVATTAAATVTALGTDAGSHDRLGVAPSASRRKSPEPASLHTPPPPAQPRPSAQSMPSTPAADRVPAALPAPMSTPAPSAAVRAGTPTPEAFRFSAPVPAVASSVALAAPTRSGDDNDGNGSARPPPPPTENADDSERLQRLVESVDAARTEQLCKRIVHDRVPPLYGGYYDRKDTRDLPLFEPTHVMSGTYVNAKGATWWKAAYSVTRGAYWGEVPDFDNRVPHEYEVKQYVTDRVGWCVEVNVAITPAMLAAASAAASAAAQNA